jgi:multicomponent K+:H+ antiporter subunit F
MILNLVLPWVTAVFAAAMLLNAWRLLRGPGVPDRILALDTLYINALALVVVLGVWQDSKLYFEVAMLIGLLGFIGTVVLAKFVLRGDIVE